jgi:tRNA modification GTPase
MLFDDTIAAIATPLVPSAIGIIRVSGSSVQTVITTLFKDTPPPICERKMHTQYAYDSQGQPIDECCFVFYAGPRSYTGEDTLEIFSHGSVYILQQIILHISGLDGCRLAKNGEFTKRAFLNGKISLSKAESIIDIIESSTQKDHRIALNQYKGHVYDHLINTRTDLMNCLEKIEASLEFPDDVGAIETTTVQTDIMNSYQKISAMVSASDYGAMAKKGLSFLILGPPNVGKSSLLNALSGQDRSIVTHQPGTTRDYIDIDIEYDGMKIRLIDTAGIRESPDDIEKIGIKKIQALANVADGYIHVHDANISPPPALPPYIDPSKPLLNVMNKMDTVSSISHNKDHYYVSCTTLAGINDLKKGLLNAFFNEKDHEPDHMLSNLRQISELKSAHQKITQTITALNEGYTLDVVSIELRDAISSLSNIIGDDFTEELLDGIFKNFCIGK